MQIWPARVYLPSASVCTAGTSIVPCVAIIACNLHRMRTGNSALISDGAGKSLYRLSSYLTAQQKKKNYRFSCGVLNPQGVFFPFSPVRRAHYLLQMLLVYLPCLSSSPTPAGALFQGGRTFSTVSRANPPSARVSFVTRRV